MLVDYLIDKGFELAVDGDDLLVKSEDILTGKQKQFLSVHKLEIIKELQASNDDRKFRFSYHWKLKNNAGAGTLISDSPPVLARKEIEDKFIGRELESFELLN